MLIPSTPIMLSLEAKWRGRTLDATIGSRRPPLSPEVVLTALVAQCGVTRCHINVDVSVPPIDFPFASDPRRSAPP
jgi:hypothetical protein